MQVDIASPFRPVFSCRRSKCFSQSRACVSVQRRGPMFLRGWQGSRSGATREVIRAVHMDGPAPSGDFWFLLVVSKGTRRRQGNWGEVVEFGFCLFLLSESLPFPLCLCVSRLSSGIGYRQSISQKPVLADSSSQTENQCRYARNAFREDSQSRACVSVQRRGPMFLRGWQGSFRCNP